MMAHITYLSDESMDLKFRPAENRWSRDVLVAETRRLHCDTGAARRLHL